MAIRSAPTLTLLDTFDRVANSNTHLLVGVALDCVEESFTEFIRCGDFEKELLRSDLARDWHNFHTFLERGGSFQPIPVQVLITDPKLSSRQTGIEFQERLVEELLSDLSFYKTTLPREDTVRIVSDFAHGYVPDDAEVLIYEPNFLFAHSGPDEPASPFFEGFGWDSCRAWHCGEELLVLLVNGMA